MHPIGIMQGRLVPPKGRGIQFFPFEEWENEFAAAKKAGIDEIEFIFDEERRDENPLWSATGIEKLKSVIKESGVRVAHVCADYFMRQPFFRVSEEQRKINITILKKLVDAANTIGAKNIEIPLVDNSSIKTPEEQKLFVDSIKECLAYAAQKGVRIGLETDLSPAATLELLKAIDSPLVHVVYDSGNSASLGHDCAKEMAAYADQIGNVHIKDRVLNGATVALGTGNADFDVLFTALANVGYRGSFTLQAARGGESQEAATIAEQKQFIEDYVKKYFV